MVKALITFATLEDARNFVENKNYMLASKEFNKSNLNDIILKECRICGYFEGMVVDKINCYAIYYGDKIEVWMRQEDISYFHHCNDILVEIDSWREE